MKVLYTKVSNQAESLKGLLNAKLNLTGLSGAATEEDYEMFETMNNGLEAELERRKQLGSQFEKVLIRTRELSEADEGSREEHQVVFQAGFREAYRALTEHAAKLQQGQLLKDGSFDEELHRKTASRVGVLLQRMSGELSKECERLGAWGVLGQGTGAALLDSLNNPLSKDQLIGQWNVR